MENFESPLINLKSSVWATGFIVPLPIAQNYLQLNDKRVVCILNDSVKIHAALMPKGKDTWFINVNKQVQKKLQVQEGSILQIEITTDDSKYGMEPPEEFLELLRQDEHGRLIFEQLTMGKQRTLLHIILKIKNVQIRIDKSIKIVEYLKRVNGNLDFKELNQALKA